MIVTGTPAGVGLGRKPSKYMKPGDTVEVEIEAMGTLRIPVDLANSQISQPHGDPFTGVQLET